MGVLGIGNQNPLDVVFRGAEMKQRSNSNHVVENFNRKMIHALSKRFFYLLTNNFIMLNNHKIIIITVSALSSLLVVENFTATRDAY